MKIKNNKRKSFLVRLYHPERALTVLGKKDAVILFQDPAQLSAPYFFIIHDENSPFYISQIIISTFHKIGLHRLLYYILHALSQNVPDLFPHIFIDKSPFIRQGVDRTINVPSGIKHISAFYGAVHLHEENISLDPFMDAILLKIS